MQNFVVLSSKEKELAFSAAGAKLMMPAYVVEKDFHVTVVLKCLFGPIWEELTAGNDHAPFVFKGGTTLSKVYGVINRMSEDVDLALCMNFLGHAEPPQESNNARDKVRIPALSDEAKRFTNGTLKDLLEKELGSISSDYSVEVSTSTDEALEVYYPQLCGDYGASQYIQPRVLIETGGRAAQLPNTKRSVNAMVSAVASEADENIEVISLDIGRTFFEKVTAVHAFINQDKIQDRSSRHLYDIAQIFNSNPELAFNILMLRDVCIHKKKYFRAGAAQYDKAEEGSVCLVPSTEEQFRSFQEDWEKMDDMFPSEKPDFDELISAMNAIERLLKECFEHEELVRSYLGQGKSIGDCSEYKNLIGDLLYSDVPNHIVIAKLFQRLRSLGHSDAHSLSLRLVSLPRVTLC